MIVDKELQFEVDTGASASVISEQSYCKLWKDNPHKLMKTHVKLQTYIGEKIMILGTIKVTVEYKTQRETLGLLVVDGYGPSLIGRDWLAKICLNLTGMLHKISSPNDL